MHVPYGGEVDIQPAGAHETMVRVRCGENVIEVVLHDDLIRQLVAKTITHIDRRAAERTLAMLEAERERRRPGERPEALAVVAELRKSDAAACGEAASAPMG